MGELRFETIVIKMLFYIMSMVSSLVVHIFGLAPSEISKEMGRAAVAGAAIMAETIKDDLEATL